MANARGKEIDTTFLSLEHARERGFIHRDYIGHCLRWSHVAKYLNQGGRYKTHHVLDVGCGREAPLAKLLFASRLTHTTGSYTGVDYGPCERPASISSKTDKFNAEFLAKTDFVKAKLPREKFDTVVSFEVMEHVEPFHSYSMLKRMREVLADDGRVFISTPCYDEKAGAAANHVNEMSYQGLLAIIRAAGLDIDDQWGVFASQKDYKKLMTPEQTALFNSLGEYYDSNVLACIFAPLFPEQSRNVLWKLKRGNPTPISGKPLEALSAQLNSNSDKWADHLKKIMADASKAAKTLR